MRHGWLLGIALLYAATVGATTLTTEFGTVLSCTNPNCPNNAASTDDFQVDGTNAVVVLYKAIAGSATLKLQQSIDNGTTYVDVAGSSQTVDLAGTVSAHFAIDKPVGRYRVFVTVCTGGICSLSIKYKAVQT